MSWLLSIVFPPPPSIFIGTMSAVSLMSLAYGGYSEVKGKNMQYSKFWNVNNLQKKKTLIGKEEVTELSGRTGMFILYTPAFLAGVVSFSIFPDEGLRFMLVDAALTIHFLKRILEVLFIHKYSGKMVLDTVIPITLSYFISTASMIYAQHLTQGFPEPTVDLKYIGVALFFVGIGGNLYHHYLLSRLREKSDLGYKIPKEGMFNLVLCPHYLFEILGFVGVFFISQTLYSFSFTLGTLMYLMGRSYATRKWYLSKFENLSKEVKCLIPFVF
ncbi:3-oxo-5-alpha-steroid 4-dehydrogenase 1-like [Telopea speciosissima]|uniref:3-oxo-5-alpha-steroid 4-dehydrogenase 1-like n=1 Tax=Telopea speciosissima TaxID=54955 RepID=UPI001CC76637|nr:3-oxo-5-alpha-steroid 4-dehydrogenase 1-like [Telopea speciosissima]